MHYEGIYCNEVLSYQKQELQQSVGQTVRAFFLRAELEPTWRLIAHHSGNLEPYILIPSGKTLGVKQKLCYITKSPAVDVKN